MKTNKPLKPTDAELEILQVLWAHGPSTVRFINNQLNQRKAVGYTTTLKIMQIMADKQMVSRQLDGRTHIYSPAVSQEETLSQLVDRLLDTAFGGSAMKLVMQALGNHKASKEEHDEIRRLLDQLEGGEK